MVAVRRLRDHVIDLRPLAVPEFRRLWIAALVAALGGSFAVMAVPARLFELTGSSSSIAASSLVAFVALAFSALWSGSLADRMDRRRLLVAAHTVLALTYLLFWLHGVLGLRSVPLLLMLVGCQGLGVGAIMTTMGAVVPRIVPLHLLAAANSLSSMVRWIGPIIGPVLAGLLIPMTGLSTLFLLDSIALTAVLWAVFRLPPILPSVARGRPPGVLEGFRYLAVQPVLLAVLALDFAAMAFGQPYSLFPELALEVGSSALGLLYAAYPAGILLTGLISGTFTRARRHGAWFIGAAMAWGISLVLVGLSPYLAPALMALVLGGGVNFVLSTFRNAITQEHTDDAMRGRIQGALTVLLIGGPQVAGVLHGLASPLIGPRATIGAGGALTVVAAVGIVVITPLWSYVPRTSRPVSRVEARVRDLSAENRSGS